MVHHILLGFLLCLSIGQLIQCQPVGSRSVDPTEGFISLPLDRSNLVVQRPYNVRENERYSQPVGLRAIDPTKGFTSLPLSTSNLVIQKPYNVPENQRYSFQDGIHRLWVYSTDKPYSPTSTTKPRTEIRITGYDYSSGVWQFEAQGYVPSGTSGVSIMQIFGASAQSTTLMLRVYNGNLAYYRAPVIVPNIYNRWFRLNVIHDVGASKVTVYVDGVLVYTVSGRGGTSHYFKCGVYAQNDESQYMESRWKGIKVLKKM